MSGRYVLGPFPDAKPPHQCDPPWPIGEDWLLNGSIWRCDDCGQHWLNKPSNLGSVWHPILSERAHELIADRAREAS